ncbi:MAG: hypothetical protein ACOYMA_19725 [Bacteroidia bacterium]
MKNLAIIFSIIFAQFSCSKDNKISNSNGEYHELKNGETCLIYQFTYLTYTFDNTNNSYLFKKIKDNLYRIDGLFFHIDSIQTIPNSNLVFMTPFIYNRYSSKYDLSCIRNAKSLSNDSIVGEYYNAWVYNTSQRVYVPDSGIFIIKIK